MKSPSFASLSLMAGRIFGFWTRRRSRWVRESEEKFSAVFQSAPVLMTLSSIPDGRCEDVNEKFLATSGLRREDVLGRKLIDLGWFTSEDLDAMVQSLLTRGRVKDLELELPTHDGRHVNLLYNCEIVAINKKPQLLSIALDITRRKRAEKHLQEALSEKEALLREVHHRVKNNLQSIIHLLDMRASSALDESSAAFLRELQGQARTMSLVYAQLSRSESLSRVDMPEYLKTLVTGVVASFGRGGDVSVEVDAAGQTLGVDQAMPCGLAVNELVTNALKHAFPQGTHPKGTIRVRLRVEGARARLGVEDDGVGLPAGVDVLESKSLGLKLVRLWAEHQLGGTFLVERVGGTSFILDFPVIL